MHLQHSQTHPSWYSLKFNSKYIPPPPPPTRTEDNTDGHLKQNHCDPCSCSSIPHWASYTSHSRWSPHTISWFQGQTPFLTHGWRLKIPAQSSSWCWDPICCHSWHYGPGHSHTVWHQELAPILSHRGLTSSWHTALAVLTHREDRKIMQRTGEGIS